MKSDQAATAKSKSAKTTSGNTKPGNNTKKDKVAFSDTSATATEKAKPRPGRGLANEGTIVSYEEER